MTKNDYINGDSSIGLRGGGEQQGGLLVDFPQGNRRYTRSSSSSSSSSTASSASMTSRREVQSSSAIVAPIQGILRRCTSEPLSSSRGDPSPMIIERSSSNSTLVSFAKKSCMSLVEYPPHDERRRRWLTHDDYDNFKRKLLRDRRSVARKLASPTTSVDILLCVGMEKIFTHDIHRLVKQRQAEHVAAILEEQERQDLLGLNDIQALSKLSFDKSEWTRRRSQKLVSVCSMFDQLWFAVLVLFK